MNMTKISRQAAVKLSDAKKEFVSRVKHEVGKSPIVSNVFVALILSGLEKFVEVDFACPCKPLVNAWFAAAYFIIPGFAASMLMLIIQGCKHQTRQETEHLVFYGLGPWITWLILVFLDGQYFACARTDWSGRFVIVDKAEPQRWCEPDNSTSSVERMKQTQQWYFHSQGIGLLILLGTVVLFGSYKLCKKRTERDESLPGPDQEEVMEAFELQ